MYLSTLNEDIDRFMVEEMGCKLIGETPMHRTYQVYHDLILTLRVIVDSQTFAATLRHCVWSRDQGSEHHLKYTTLEEAKQELFRECLKRM